MAWLSKNSFSPSDPIANDDLNNLANDVRAWGGNVNGGGYHLSNVIIDNYFPGAGVPLLSPIHIIPTSTDYSSQLRLDSEAAGNPARWILIKEQSPETGANAGSNFAIERCGDDGKAIDSPIAINRASGLVTLGAQQWSGNVNGGGFTLTNVVIPSVFQDPTTTLGDIIVRGPSAIGRLGVGAPGMVLQADPAQPFGMKWAVSPAVPSSTQIIAGTGLGGGGPLTANVTLTANVVTVFGRTGAVGLTAADITGATGVIQTRQVLAGAGMTGGGALSADVTLNALVTSVFGRTGAVTLTAADVSAGGGVPATRQVLPGAGMSGGGPLSADVTLNALVTSVFGRTGAVMLQAGDIITGGGVPATRKILTPAGSGLANGGDLSADLSLAVVADSTVQKVNWASGAGSLVGTRSTLNFIQGANIHIALADNAASNRMDVTFDASGVTAIWKNGVLIGNRPAINFIEGSNVTITPSDNTTQNRVDITISAVGGTGGGAGQTPWTAPIDAAGNSLANVSYIGVDRSLDITTRIAVQTTGTETGLRVASALATSGASIEVDNDNATAKLLLTAYGSAYGGSLQATSGLNATAAPMTFAINSSEAMRISTGKRILIGTATDNGSHILQVNGAIKSLTGGIVFPDGTTQTTAITSTGQNQSPWLTDINAANHNLLALNAINPTGPALAIGKATPGYALDVGGDINTTGVFRINGTPVTAGSLGAVPSTRLINTTAPLGGGGALSGDLTLTVNVGAVQTPWLQNIQGANNTLYNVANISIANPSPPVAKLHIGNSSSGSGAPTYRGSIVLDEYYATLASQMGLEFQTRGDGGGFGWRISSLANNADLVYESRSASATWTERIRFANGGNIGVATTTPLGGVHSAANGGWWSSINLGASFVVDGPRNNSIAMLDSNHGNPLALTNSAGDFVIYSAPALTDSTTGPVPLVTVKRSGLLGVGAASPTALLSVAGYASGSPTATYHGAEALTSFDIPGNVEMATGWLGASPFSWWIQSRGGGIARPLALNAAGGAVGIATTNPLTTMHIAGASTTYAAELGSLLVTGGGSQFRLALGYDGAGDRSWIQSVHNGVAPTSLLLNPEGGLVSINTGAAAPGATLDVKTAANIHFGVMNYSASTATIGGFNDGFTAWVPVSINPGGSVYLCSAGGSNVGIALTNATTTLAIGGPTNNNGTAAPTYRGVVLIDGYSNTLASKIGLEFQGRGDGGGSGWRLSSYFTNISTDFVFEARETSATWTERMRITNAGSLGIGVAGPLAALDCKGNGSSLFPSYNIEQIARFRTGSNGAIVIDTGASGTTALRALFGHFNSSAFSIARFDTAQVAAPIEDLYIAANGNVGVGNNVNPAYKLDIAGDCNITGTYRVNGTPLAASGAPGAWTAYTPTFTDGSNAAISLTSNLSSYCISGSVLFLQINLGYTATGAGTLRVGLPVSVTGANSSIAAYQHPAGVAYNNVVDMIVAATYLEIYLGTNPSGVGVGLKIGGILRLT